MFSLVVWACLSSNCAIYPVAHGFSSGEVCIENSIPLVEGWKALHPELKLREGVRPICSANGMWLLHRFRA